MAKENYVTTTKFLQKTLYTPKYLHNTQTTTNITLSGRSPSLGSTVPRMLLSASTVRARHECLLLRSETVKYSPVSKICTAAYCRSLSMAAASMLSQYSKTKEQLKNHSFAIRSYRHQYYKIPIFINPIVCRRFFDGSTTSLLY